MFAHYFILKQFFIPIGIRIRDIVRITGLCKTIRIFRRFSPFCYRVMAENITLPDIPG